MITAVMFDLGGTLIEMGGGGAMSLGLAGAKAAYDRLKELGVSLPSYMTYFARVSATLSGMAFPSGGLREIDINNEIKGLFSGMAVDLDEENLDETISAWYNPFTANARLADGVEATLLDIEKRNLRMCVVSNSIWRGKFLERGLEKLGVLQFFEFVLASSDVGYRKPSPVIMETALRRLGVGAEDAVMVGDSRTVDIAAAKQMGMRSVLVQKNNQPGPEPDAVIGAFSELPGVLDSMRG